MHARPYRIGRTLSLLLILLGCWIAPDIAGAATPSRVALVVGNGDYQHADKLANPVTDARRMRDVLQGIGFEVVYGENLDKRSFERTIGHFAAESSEAQVALVFYAGHGATFDDVAYAVPVDAQFHSVEEMPYELVPVETMVGELRRAKGVRIAILDACRDDAAEKALKRTASRGGEVTRGLARMKNPEGLILAYSTQYLDTAADGPPDGDSPFTTALLRDLPAPGLDVKDLFFKIGQEVIEATQGRQRPEISISFFGSFSLVEKAGAGPVPTPTVTPPLPPPAASPPPISSATPAVVPSPTRPPPQAASTIPAAPQAAAAPVPPAKGIVPPVPVMPPVQVARLEATPDPAIEACDRLAAAPTDPLRPARVPGVEFDQIDTANAIPTCRKAVAAAPGIPRLRFELGRALHRNGGDFSDVPGLYRQAADAGDTAAINDLGTLYKSGRGLPQDDGEAVRWFRKAADAGNPNGMQNLGVMYKLGRGVPADDAQAVQWFRRAADGGNFAGMNELGVMYHKGLGVTKDPIQAVFWFRKGTAGGNILAMDNLGFMYKTGQGVEVNDPEAVRLFRAAADAGNANAMNNLATMYNAGRGVPPNDDAAVRLFEKAAAAGNGFAMNNLGLRYKQGRRVPRDLATALDWFRKSAAAGNALGLDNLGVMYRDGLGVKVDLAEAQRDFHQSAEGGNPRAMVHLSELILAGKGTRGSDAEAAGWLRKAADDGNGEAMIDLGQMYQAGRGVKRDPAEASRLFRQAQTLQSTARTEGEP